MATDIFFRILMLPISFIKFGHCVQVAQAFTDAVMCTIKKWKHVYVRKYLYKPKKLADSQ